MHIVVHDQLIEMDSQQWNELLPDDNPFLRHEFLHGLELCGCVNESTGWLPQHIAIYSDQSCTTLIAAMPCYQKNNSYGEYIFDWAWADAHFRHGLEYYPKLSNAIPFTPATGQRVLVHPNYDESQLIQAAIKAATDIVDEKKLSSFHSLFLTQDQSSQFEQMGLMQRHSSQFHWRNQGYIDFDSFLARMSSKKRKNIKRERRRVKESKVLYRWLSGDQLDTHAVETMYLFYSRTIEYYGAQSYLNKDFFEYIAQHFNAQTLFLFAYHEEQVIAGGLYFRSDDTLYGRYWGALDNFHSVHFETCYYQAIEWCIKNGYARFEAGAQGEHKLARGLEPATTYSAHYIRNPQFSAAIDDFLKQEKAHIDGYSRSLKTHSPFKQEP